MDIGMRPVSTIHQNTVYDYIDNHYEDVSTPVRINHPMSEQSERKSATSGISEVLSDFDDKSTTSIIRLVDKRKKYNPLYMTSSSSSPQHHNDSNESPKLQSIQNRITCHSLLLFVVLTSSFSAVGLNIYLMMEFESHHTETARILGELQDKYENITVQNQILQSVIAQSGINTTALFSSPLNIFTNTSLALQSLKEQLSEATHEMSFTQNDLKEQFDAFNFNISQYLQHLTGIIESKDLIQYTKLSSCYYKNDSSEVVSGNRDAPTLWSPSEPDLKRLVPMFVSCSVKGGTKHLLERKYISVNKLQYRCLCGGVVSGYLRRLCTLHLWLCPLGSST